MNKKFFILIIIALFGVSPIFVFAQESNVLPIPQKREEIKKYIEEKKLQKVNEISQRRLEIKSKIQNSESKIKLSIFDQDKVSKLLSVIFEKFDAVIVKYDGIIVRIENRISKLDEQGVDTKTSKELLLVAQNKLSESFVLISAIDDELKNAIVNEVSIGQLKQSVEDCKNSLKLAHASLIEVIVSLKETESFSDFINE